MMASAAFADSVRARMLSKNANRIEAPRALTPSLARCLFTGLLYSPAGEVIE